MKLQFKIEKSGLKTRTGEDIYILIHENGKKRQATEEEVLLFEMLKEKMK